MCQALERTVNIYLTSIPSDNDEDYQSITTIVSEPNTPYSQEYISLLARQGKIDAYKEGRNWVTTKKPLTITYPIDKESVYFSAFFFYFLHTCLLQKLD